MGKKKKKERERNIEDIEYTDRILKLEREII